LVETGTAGEARGVDVMEFSRRQDLGDVANLGMTLAEAKQLLARVQQEIVSAQAQDHAVRRPACSSFGGGVMSRIGGIIRWRRCSGRRRRGCRDFAASFAVAYRRALTGCRILGRHQSWTGCSIVAWIDK
jgi:hypothetical protein